MLGFDARDLFVGPVGSEPESSAKIRDRVIHVRQKQLERFATSREKLYCNAQMSSPHIRTFCELSADCERLLERAMTEQGLSARAPMIAS